MKLVNTHNHTFVYKIAEYANLNEALRGIDKSASIFTIYIPFIQ